MVTITKKQLLIGSAILLLIIGGVVFLLSSTYKGNNVQGDLSNTRTIDNTGQGNTQIKGVTSGRDTSITTGTMGN